VWQPSRFKEAPLLRIFHALAKIAIGTGGAIARSRAGKPTSITARKSSCERAGAL
jgi:hypothetical protein